MRLLPISIVFLASAALLQTHCSSAGGGKGAAGSSSGNGAGASSGSGLGLGASSSAESGDGGSDEGGNYLLPDGATGGEPPVVNFVPGVTVSTIAGSSQRGNADGMGTAATFSNPTGIKVDHNGNLVVVDYDGWDVRLVTPAGSVTTIVEGGGFSLPFAVAVNDDGSYCVSTDDDPNDAGDKTPTSGTIWSMPQGAPGQRMSPSPLCQDLARPRGIAPALSGDLFVVERYRNLVGTLATATGAFTAWAGSNAAFADGVGTAAMFNSPIGGARMPDGSFIVADSLNGAIRHVTSDGTVSTIAGDGVPGMIDGLCSVARFTFPRDVAADAAGNIYVSDGLSQRIRRIRTGGGACIVETLAGNGTLGFADGPGDTASFYGEEGIDVTPDGSTLYVADGDLGDGSAFHRVRTLSIPPIGSGEDAGTASGGDAGGDAGGTTAAQSP